MLAQSPRLPNFGVYVGPLSGFLEFPGHNVQSVAQVTRLTDLVIHIHTFPVVSLSHFFLHPSLGPHFIMSDLIQWLANFSSSLF